MYSQIIPAYIYSCLMIARLQTRFGLLYPTLSVIKQQSNVFTIYYSNHTLHNIENIDTSNTVYHLVIESLLCLNKNQDKTAVIRQKILTHYFLSDINSIEVFVGMFMSFMSHAIEWIGKETNGFTLMYNVTRGIPSLFKS